jgi:Divergent InlB B-repeat domain/PASTA domain
VRHWDEGQGILSSALGALPLRHAGAISVALVVLAAAGAWLTPASALAAQTKEGASRASSGAATLGWQSFGNPPPFNPGVMFLLTDGTVMVQDQGPTNGGGTGTWWRLTPDGQGNYSDGTWAQTASMPPGYAPLYTASAVLPDGRLIIEGGEDNNGINGALTNQGAIFNPVANTWTTVAPPNGAAGSWPNIGDAPSVVLADGSFLLGGSGSGNASEAILNASTLSWTATGAGKADPNGEEGFTLLPNGEVLTVDTSCPSLRNTEIYAPPTGSWTSGGLTPSQLINCPFSEIGPQLLMDNGKVFVEGATGATALYATATGTWSTGPNLPAIGGKQFEASDAPSALLPDGKVLLSASPVTPGQPNGGTPTHFFLFDGTTLTQIADDADAPNESSYFGYMLVLPTGQVLFDYRLGPGSLELFSDGGTPNATAAPTITSLPTNLAAGKTYTLSGLQLNGLSEGAAFGDDYQMSTDYPLVQITNDGSGDVAYARTSGMTNRSIAAKAPSCTNFTLPSGIGTGASELRVIANGIASAPVPVTVGAGGSGTNACPNYTLSLAKAGAGAGTATSSAAGIACGATCSHVYPNGTIVTLSASPATGSAFAGWSGGGCSGTAPCVVTMSGNTSVTATFSLIPETLAVSKTGDGAGAVTGSPAGISCGQTCSHAYSYGSSVTLTATAAKGSSFGGWAGACTGRSSCVIAMTDAQSVTARFVKDCVVPKLKGKGLAAAKRQIKAHDCSVGKIRRAFSTKIKKGRVISQKPKAHKRLKHGAKVNLVVSRGP